MKQRILLILAGSLLPGFWQAATAEWSVGGYAGASETLDSYLRIVQPGSGNDLRLTPVRFLGRSFESPIYYGYRAGYFFTPVFGLEAEFIHFKIHSRVEDRVRAEGMLAGERIDREAAMNEIVERFDISHGVNLLLGNAVFRKGFWKAGGKRNRILLTARAGAGGSIPHPESNVLGRSRAEYQWGRPGVQAAGGAELRIWGGIYAIAEYKFTRTRQKVRIAGGTAETLLQSHHAVTGISYHFP
ncbi:MAG: hypothetical protein ACRD7E_10745 [Bryobacteraceae bacterium]